MDTTHEVFNQPAPLTNLNLFATNRPLRDALHFNAPSLATAELDRLGAALGSAEMQTHARLAHVHPPQLHTHDRVGHRLDTVEFHPSYHALMAWYTFQCSLQPAFERQRLAEHHLSVALEMEDNWFGYAAAGGSLGDARVFRASASSRVR